MRDAATTTVNYLSLHDALPIYALGFGSNPTENFTVTASDGSLTGNATLAVNLTGANDTPVVSTPSAIALVDTAAADSRANKSRTELETAYEGTSLSYGINNGTT